MALLEEFEGSKVFQQGEGYALITNTDEITWSPDSQPDKTALKIVLQDYGLGVSWVQTQSWTLEWMLHDRLYLFKIPVKFWDGTNIPRSHLGMPLVYEHIESLLPQLVSGIFGDDPPFNSTPRPGTSMEAARANNAILGWELKKINAREEVRKGLKSMLLYGIGIWKWGWQTYTEKRTVYQREKPYKYVSSPAGLIKIPQKGSNKKKAIPIEKVVDLPLFEYRHPRHVVIDPGTRASDIRKAKWVIDVQYLTILELDELRNYEGYDIPERAELLKLLFPPEEVPQLNPVETPPLNLFQEFQPMLRWQKSTVDKMRQPLEVLEYWNNDRVYTILQRKLVIRNEPNPLGRIPFLSVAMGDVLDSFWGVGVGMLIGNEQRMQQGVINTFLDDLSLNLNGMFMRKRGANVLTQQLRMRPGGIIDADDEKGVSLMQRNPIPIQETQSVLQASDSRAARRTAANEQSVQGTMPSENSSITRTATGVNSLGSGTANRLQYIVENFSYQVFIPLLDYIHEMNGQRLDPDVIDRLLSEELGIAYEGDSIDLINGQYDFNIVAGARMSAKASMRQTIPLMFQYLLTDPVIQSLAQEGKKVNVAELVRMVFDVTGWPNQQDVITAMTPEDVQRQQQNSPAAQQQAQQQAQLQHEASMEQIKTSNKSQLLEQDSENRAGRDIIKELIREPSQSFLGIGGK
jgi:hypothetical protein